MFLPVGREKRVGETWAYRIATFTLCVLGSMLIDGLHIPIVTSLRRLSTVGRGGVGAIVSQHGRAVSALGDRGDGAMYRHFSWGLLLLPGRTGQIFWDRNGACEDIRQWAGGSKLGCGEGREPEVLV